MLSEYMTPDDICRELDVSRDFVYRKYTKDLKEKNIPFWNKDIGTDISRGRNICRKQAFRKLLLEKLTVYRRSEYITEEEYEALRQVSPPMEYLAEWQRAESSIKNFSFRERRKEHVLPALAFKEIVQEMTRDIPDAEERRLYYMKYLPGEEWKEYCRPPEIAIDIPERLQQLLSEEDEIAFHNVKYYMNLWEKSREMTLRELYRLCAYTVKYENKTYYWLDTEDEKRRSEGWVCAASLFVKSRREWME